MLGNGTSSYHDTIVAVATPSGPAGRAVLRLCGREVRDLLVHIWRPATCNLRDKVGWETGHALVEELLAAVSQPTLLSGWIKLDSTGRSLDCDLYFWPDERSFTRTPLAEIHVLGSDPIVSALLEQICEHGARLAQEGEFTLRAFLGGRIDLPQAEAVLGVIQARSDREFDIALQQLAGGLSEPLYELRDVLLDVLAEVEAGLDFVDEDIPLLDEHSVDQRLKASLEKAQQLLVNLEGREKMPLNGRVVLLGQPNVGKSSLFNCLTGAKALESPQPGTTRDYLSAPLEMEGLHCELIDTAGSDFSPRDSAECEIAKRLNTIDMEVQAMTVAQCETASLKILCLDATASLKDGELDAIQSHRHSGDLVILTKWDAYDVEAGEPDWIDDIDVRTSSFTGEGIEALQRVIRDRFADGSAAGQLAVATTAARCRESLQAVVCSLEEALETLVPDPRYELVAAAIRSASDALGEMVGAVYTEDLLEKIFSRFCIGK